jgi:hypothetical protein
MINIKNKGESVLVNDNNNIININTLVYNLPFLSNDKAKKNGGYTKIALELKKIFNFNPLNEFEDNKNNNDDNNKKEKYIPKVIAQLCNIDDYLTIIKKPPNERSVLDLYLLIKCLSNTKLGKYFKEEFDNNKEIYEKLIAFCAVEIKYRKVQKGEIIFKIGDPPDNFYIILQGKMDIVKPQQIKVSMTGKQYFCYLMDLKKRGDKYTFNLCIENNISNYIIEKKKFIYYHIFSF